MSLQPLWEDVRTESQLCDVWQGFADVLYEIPGSGESKDAWIPGQSIALGTPWWAKLTKG